MKNKWLSLYLQEVILWHNHHLSILLEPEYVILYSQLFIHNTFLENVKYLSCQYSLSTIYTAT